MDEAQQIALVRRALQISQTTSGCLEWIDLETANRARSSTNGLTPEYLVRQLIAHSVAGKPIVRRKEIRQEKQWRREWWFRVILKEPDFTLGIFVELERTDADEDVPIVTILNIHPEHS